MKRGVRGILKQIDAFLVRNQKNEAARDLWNILAALRGPDEPELAGAKSDTTEIIRTAAFPRAAKLELGDFKTMVPASFASPGATTVRLPFLNRSSFSQARRHFRNHASSAATALDLGVEEYLP